MPTLRIGTGIDRKSSQSFSSYWTTRTVTIGTVTAASDTSLSVTHTNNGTLDYTGHKYYISTDNVNFTLNKTVGTIGTGTTLTGLTAYTKYYVKVAPYKSSSIGNLSSSDYDTTFDAIYTPIYNSYTAKPAKSEAQRQSLFYHSIGATIWGKIDAAWLWAAHTNANSEALTNLKNPTGQKALLVAGSSGSPVFNPYTGFHGAADGSLGYINTKWNPAVNGVNFTRNSASMGAYVGDNSTTGTMADFGVGDGTQIASMTYSQTTVYDRCYLNSLTYTAFTHVAYYTKYKAWNRSGASAIERYENHTSTSGSRASVGVPNGEVYALCQNSSGTPSSYTTREQGFLYFGGSLTTAEHNTIDNALNAYMDAPRVASDLYTISENDYFYYYQIKDHRLIPSQIAYQSGDVKLVFKQNYLYLTTDNCKTWTAGLAFTPDNDIEFGYVFDNYNILFATKNHLYKSTDQLASYSEVTVIDIGGGNFSPAATGNNFRLAGGQVKTYLSGTEICVWGNYTNVNEGNSEINIFYSKNNCAVKVAYKFGQNPAYDSLGDASNTTKCRHMHGVIKNPNDDSFWAYTGDYTNGDAGGHPDECHWIKGVYNSGADTWAWVTQYSGGQDSYYKSLGLKFTDTYLYWISDATASAAKCGIWRVPLANIGNTGSYQQIYDVEKTFGPSLFGSDNDIISNYTIGEKDKVIAVSKDNGVTTHEVTMSDVNWFYTSANFFDVIQVFPKDTGGWYANNLALSSDFIMNKGVLMIKLK